MRTYKLEPLGDLYWMATTMTGVNAGQVSASGSTSGTSVDDMRGMYSPPNYKFETFGSHAELVDAMRRREAALPKLLASFTPSTLQEGSSSKLLPVLAIGGGLLLLWMLTRKR